MTPLANVTPETPVGTPVLYVDGLYQLFFTQTRSQPWRLKSGDWTVLIAGRTGGYSLEKLFVVDVIANRALVEAEFKKLVRSQEMGWSKAEERKAVVVDPPPPAKEEGPKPLCADLRHVCGKCGFRWPERPAYDRLVLENAHLHAEIAKLRKEMDKAP